MTGQVAFARALCTGIVLSLTLVQLSQADTQTVVLAEQDFQDGQIINGPQGSVRAFNDASIGEPPPFDRNRGSDLGGGTFDASWTFNCKPRDVSNAQITFGISDCDSGATGSQLASFVVDGVDLTAILDQQFEERACSNIQYAVFIVDLPGDARAELGDGIATFSLRLKGPTHGFPYATNSGGLDFSSLVVVGMPRKSGGFVLVVR